MSLKKVIHFLLFFLLLHTCKKCQHIISNLAHIKEGYKAHLGSKFGSNARKIVSYKSFFKQYLVAPSGQTARHENWLVDSLKHLTSNFSILMQKFEASVLLVQKNCQKIEA